MNMQTNGHPAPEIPDMSFLRGMHVLLAFSGGADSVALLHMLACAQREGMLRLSAAHFCHGIRGQEALDDEAFCCRMCAGLNVAYYSGSADVPAEAAASGEGLETAARRLRHAFLKKIAAQTGANVIALAHHADDQAETILMHLLRGSGSAGMQGMDRLGDGLARPLLGMRKSDIIHYLRQRNIPWREDSTNTVADNPRNILRLQAIPALTQAYPGATAALCRHGEIVREENALLNKLTQSFLQERCKKYAFGIRLQLDPNDETAILRRAVVKLLGEHACWENVCRITALAQQPRGAVDISAGLRAERCPGGLYILNRSPVFYEETPLKLNGSTYVAGLGTFTAQSVYTQTLRHGTFTQTLHTPALEGAVIRTRRQGDRIHPLGMQGSKSLSDYFTDIRLDRPLRDHVPLLAVGSEILWAVGLGISRLAALNGPGEATKVEFEQEEYTC